VIRSGNSGCNSPGGNYKVEGDQVTFDQIVSTLMACDDARMAQEDAVHKVLTDTATYRIEGNTLTLTNNDTVLILTR
jgi:putative lipoprotein